MLALQIAAGVAAAILLLLAIPVELRFQVRGVQPLRGSIAFRALFGLWRMRIAMPGPRRDGSSPRTPSQGKTTTRPAPRRGVGRAHLLALWRDAGLHQGTRNRLRNVLQTLQWRDLRLYLRLGLDDPADTAWLWALLWPLGAGLAGLSRAEIAIEPDFAEPACDLDAQGRLVLVPLRLLGALAALAGAFALAALRLNIAGRRTG